MTPDEFQATSIAILRSAVGWQSAIARRLRSRETGGPLPSRTVRRWLAAGQIPDWAAAQLADLTGRADIVAWPRDEWMIGDALGGDGRRREYIAHLQPPRFVARVVAVDAATGDPEPGEHPADLVSGVTYAANDETVLCEITWIDEPAPGEIVKWLEAASDELERDSGA